MKRIISILLSLAVVVTMCMPVLSFGAGTTHTITVNNSNTGHTYEAYQIIKGDVRSLQHSSARCSLSI